MEAGTPRCPFDPELAEWLARIRSEYTEMPGLRLTQAQAERFWGLDARLCDRLLIALIEGHFLRQTVHGAYVRADIVH